MGTKLTPRMAIFYGEFLIDGNATRAAIAAGAPESSAHVAGARWLKNPKVAAAIAAAHVARAKKLEITSERVLEEMMKLAIFDPGKLYDQDGNRIPVARLDDITRAAIAAIDDEITDGPGRVRTHAQKIKFADKGQNLERLGRYLKLFTDRIEHDGRVTLEQLVCGKQEAA